MRARGLARMQLKKTKEEGKRGKTVELFNLDQKKMRERSKKLLRYMKYLYKAQRYQLIVVTTNGASLYDISTEEYLLNFRNNRQYIDALLVDDRDEDYLTDKMSNTTSIISTSGNHSSNNSHDHRLIHEIAQEMRELEELRYELSIINALPQRQKHILIAHGVVGITYDDIASAMGKSAKWIQANYNKALLALAVALPNEIYIKVS